MVDAEEFEALYRATARDLLRYARRRGATDAEDLVAEAYAVAWRRRADLPPPALRRAWLFGVARTLLKADGRTRQRQDELVVDLGTQPSPPAGDAGSGSAAAVVAAALARLTPRDREVLQLVTWEGLTPAELAVALGVRPGAARVRLFRARRALASDREVRALVEGGVDPGLSAELGSRSVC